MRRSLSPANISWWHRPVLNSWIRITLGSLLVPLLTATAIAEIPLFTLANNTLVLEAESAQMDPGNDSFSWEINTQDGVTFASTDDQNRPNANWEDGTALSFQIDVQTPGEYWLGVRKLAKDGDSDSVWVIVNGNPISGSQFTGATPIFLWTDALSLGSFEPGIHQVEIRRREDGYQLDRLIVSLDKNNIPSGSKEVGPPATHAAPGVSTKIFFEAENYISQEAPMVVEFTDNILVANTNPLGVHFGADTYYDSAILKKRVTENFEGSIRRTFVLADDGQPESNGLYLYGINRELEAGFFNGGDAYVLTGPNLMKKARITSAERRPHRTKNRSDDTTFIKLDRSVTWSPDIMNGLLLVKDISGEGQHPWQRLKWVKDSNGKSNPVYEINSTFAIPNTTRIITGDTPPNVGQAASLELDSRNNKTAWIKFRARNWDAGNYDGRWVVRLWAKRIDNSASLKVRSSTASSIHTFSPTSSWKQYTFELELEVPWNADTSPLFMLEIESLEGRIRIDNVETWKKDESSNPTAFSATLVEALQRLNPGSLRYLRNTKDSYLNSLLPELENASREQEGLSDDRFGTHDFYTLCQYLGADPWATTPGTLLPEEIDQLMEYHAAPANVGMGALRARLGQAAPWTDVFDKIHIQFGNEAITFGGTGYYGPDYWKSLVQRAKNSPYYDADKFVFHLNEQGGGLERLFGFHPNFDRGTINGYHIFGLYKDQVDQARNKAGFYDFVYASAWHMWMDKRNNKNWNNLETSKNLGKELSIYEGGNYHTTFSSSNNVPMDQINAMLAGRAGGVSAVNSSLILLKHYGARTQMNFSLTQFQFKPTGGFGNLPESIRGWGGITDIGNPDKQRFRPRFLALEVVNKAAGGNLVETRQSGDDLTFSVKNRFGAGYGPSRDPVTMTVSDVPRIHHYGFKEGKRRGLVLVSNDPRNDRTVEVRFPGTVKDGKATIWTLASENLEDTNEPDWEPAGPAVTVNTEEVNWKNRAWVTVPAGSIISVEWYIQ